MGRELVTRAFALYAQPLRDCPQAMVCLVFMANVPKDSDAEPSFYMGTAALAELALGRSGTDTDLRWVRRALTKLREVGAISTTRRPAPGRRMATYRLHLDAPASIEHRTRGALRSGVDNPVDNRAPRSQRRTGVPYDVGPVGPMHVGRVEPYKAPEVDIGKGKTRGETASHPPRDVRTTPATKTALRAVDGGRSDSHDGTPVQLPFLAVVPDPEPEPVVWEGIRDAR